MHVCLNKWFTRQFLWGIEPQSATCYRWLCYFYTTEMYCVKTSFHSEPRSATCYRWLCYFYTTEMYCVKTSLGVESRAVDWRFRGGVKGSGQVRGLEVWGWGQGQWTNQGTGGLGVGSRAVDKSGDRFGGGVKGSGQIRGLQYMSRWPQLGFPS